MKLNHYLSGLFLILFTPSVQSNAEPGPNFVPQPVKLLVLVDKSASIRFTSDQIKKLPAELNVLIVNHVENNSTLGIYFLNSVAMSKAYYKTTIHLEEPDLSGGGITKQKATNNYKQQLMAEKIIWKKKIKAALDLKASVTTSNETDIWGSSSQIQNFFQSQGNKNLYIYSDMIHSTKALDHHKSSPKDEQTARQLAKKNLPGMLGRYQIKNGSLSGISIHVIFPGDAISFNKNKIMEAYWRTVFEGLGAKNIAFD